MIRLLIPITLMLTGCGFTDSALKVAAEGTARVNSGYKAKIDMTKAITEYLALANKDCGVNVRVVDNVPVTTVKECIRMSDAMASVESMPIVQPQKVADMLESTGNFFVKATNLVVPVASLYYGSENHIATTNASIAMNASDNASDSAIFGSYATNFDKSSDSISDSYTNISDVVNESISESITDYSTTVETEYTKYVEEVVE